MIGINEIILLALLGAVFSTDITAFAQFMISRPVFCAPVVGYLVGDIKTGLWVGMIVELVWIGIIPMGAAVPQDTTSVAILGTIWAVRSFPGEPAAGVLALALAVPAGILFKLIDVWMRYYNVRIVHWVEEGVAAGKESRISTGVYFGLFLFFFKAFAFYAILIGPGVWLVRHIYPLCPAPVLQGCAQAWRLLPLIGLGLFLINFNGGKMPGTK